MMSVFGAVTLAASAHAVTFVVDGISVSGGGSTDGSTTATIAVGETVTIDFTLYPEGTPLGAITVAATNYATNLVGFVEGGAAASAANTSLFFGIVPQGGVVNNAGTAGDVVVENVPPPRVIADGAGAELLFNGLIFPAQTAAGDPLAFDRGENGLFLSDGDSHFSVTYEGLNEGQTSIEFGPQPGDIGSIVLATGADLGKAANFTIEINVPEPGALAASTVALASVMGIAVTRRRA